MNLEHKLKKLEELANQIETSESLEKSLELLKKALLLLTTV